TFSALGAKIECRPDTWVVQGTGGELSVPENVVDVGNSGTTVNVALGTAALLRKGLVVFTGDHQIRRRPAGSLIAALNDLGARVEATRGNGCPPIVVRGRLRGGTTSMECKTSQYLTSLLINAPLGDGDSTIRVPLLHEVPYVEITLDWLARLGIKLERDGMKEFRVPGGQGYKAFTRRIPADFSSATFFLCAGAIGDNELIVQGLDLNDPQGDNAVLDYLRAMGARVEVTPDGVRVRPGNLKGCRIDMNATPDAVPMMAALACFAQGTTTLANVPQARIKETDRIAVMREELTKLGARIRELPDGLVIEQSKLTGAEVSGHDDHRVVMSLAVAASAIPGETTIRTAEAAAVTFPAFADLMRGIGADIRSTE
ncbi:MAG: 3-phosphoshikimate 1-carboxyvinyltransferase, partial [Verrucomicrobia bacterium]|nr:3-phosphoshikimate 1-carboxyvinyltransferase [Verrucomicrobiota bacterium]